MPEPRVFSFRLGEELAAAFSRHQVEDRSKLVDGRFPVASLEDIIKSKRAANRAKDRESLPRLEAFLEYLREKGQ